MNKRKKLKLLVAMLLAIVIVLNSYPMTSDAAIPYYEYGTIPYTGIDKFDKFANHPDYTTGAPWANIHPKLSKSGASGCAAYCADFTKYCYGIDGITSRDSYKDPSQIRAGDVVHLTSEGSGHWFVVLRREGKYLLTGDGNWGDVARIGWNYMISGKDVLGSRHHFDVGYHFISPLSTSGKWVKDSKGWRYTYPKGLNARHAWVKSGNQWYYIANKYMVTGLKKIEGKKYFFKNNGAMYTGWKKIDGQKYYFKPKGPMATGWLTIDEQKYYFDKKGSMVTGWKKINGKKYYFKSNGVMITGWKKIDGQKYYFNPNGVMVTGTKTIEGVRYTFDKTGALIQ